MRPRLRRGHLRRRRNRRRDRPPNDAGGAAVAVVPSFAHEPEVPEGQISIPLGALAALRALDERNHP